MNWNEIDPIAIGVCVIVILFMIGTVVMLLLDPPGVTARRRRCPVSYIPPPDRVDVSHISIPSGVASRLRHHMEEGMENTIRMLAVTSLLTSIQDRSRGPWYHVTQTSKILLEETLGSLCTCDVSILVSFLVEHCTVETAAAVCNSVIDEILTRSEESS